MHAGRRKSAAILPTLAQLAMLDRVRLGYRPTIHPMDAGDREACIRRGWISRYDHEYSLTTVGLQVLEQSREFQDDE